MARIVTRVVRRRPGVLWDVYVGRPSDFGNPFHVGEVASFAREGDWLDATVTPGVAVELFRSWIVAPEQDELFDRIRHDLCGADLACWCPLDEPCHADVLLEIANS